jgi:hypothetical protein
MRNRKCNVDSEYQLNNLNELQAQCAAEKRYAELPAEMDERSISIRYSHLKWDILGEAIEELESNTDVVLPWNLNKVDQWPGIYEIDEEEPVHPREQVCELVHRCCQMAGWLRAAATLPGVCRLLKKTQSIRGMGSPYTTLDLWDFVNRNPSPGRTERQLWKVKRRAQAILAPWEGEHHPSWNSIGHALNATRSVGKAAVIVAARTLHSDTYEDYEWNGGWGYEEAREFLTSIRSARFPIADNSDGVLSRREAQPTLAKLGYAVFRIRVADQYGRFSKQWLVRSAEGRTFHSESWEAKEALYEALEAWREQIRLEEFEADLIGFLRGTEGYCPLITFQDSRDAGNCGWGTETWLRKHGWDKLEFAPGHWLIPHLHERRVRNVAKKVYQDFREVSHG